MNKSAPSPIHAFFARQPVFTRNREVWGYELLYRQGVDAQRADFDDIDSATLCVTASACHGSLGDVQRGKKVLVNFSARTILERLPHALPAEMTVIEVSETIYPSGPLLEALREFKEAGYWLALDDFTGMAEASALHPLADLVIIDVLDKSREQLSERADWARSMAPRAALLAKRVEDETAASLAAGLGFDFLQGFFFKRPETFSDRRLGSMEASRLNLLRLIQCESPDPRRLADAIRSDAAISFRLLRFLNCPLFGFPERVRSIERAVTCLGMLQLRNWLRVVILADIAVAGDSEELPHLAAQRAKFLKSAGEKVGLGEAEAESLFLLGLFSLLDAMLGTPMAEILEILPLDEELAAALRGEPGGRAPWLDMVMAFEQGDWGKLDDLLEQLGLEPGDAARSYAESLDWANALFQSAGRAGLRERP